MEKNKTDKLAKVSTEKEKTVALVADFGTVYIKVRGNEIMKPVKAQLALHEAMGHIYKVKDDYAITSEGYSLLNKVASINIVTPQKVMVDERELPNPCIERNPKTKLIETVNIRKIGIGYSPAGNITVVDKTLLYNLYAYFIESVQAKMKKVEWKDGKKTDKKLHPDCAILGTEDEKPEKEGRWVFFETVSPLGIWVNYEDAAIIDCLSEHTQKQRFGDRIAQTIVERNIMKSHPAIGVSRVQPQKGGDRGHQRAFVTVYGYRHDFGPAQIDEILAQAEKASKTIDVKAEVIERVDEVEEALAINEIDKEDKAIEPKKKKKLSPGEMKEPPEEYYLKQQEEKKENEGGS